MCVIFVLQLVSSELKKTEVEIVANSFFGRKHLLSFFCDFVRLGIKTILSCRFFRFLEITC